MKIGIVGNPRYAALREVLTRLARHVAANGHTVVSEGALIDHWPEPVAQLGADIGSLDLLITFGGDGTLLRGIRLLGDNEIPVLSFNLGEIGFLTSTKPELLEEALDMVARGEHSIEQRFTLEVERVGTDGSVENCRTVLNDVVVHKPQTSRVIRVRVSVDGEEVGQYTADGMIVATASGSTAYSLSAGGPIVLPHVDAMVVTPICPHTLRVRPVVVPGTATVVLESIPRGTEEPLVQLDGQHVCTLKRGESVVVRRAPLSVHLVRLGREGFFARMRQKLEWGDLSDRERMTRAD